MGRYFFIFIYLLFAPGFLFAQIFDSQIIETNNLDIRYIESESFQLDADNNAHLVIHCLEDSSSDLYYINNTKDGKTFSEPKKIIKETITPFERVFLHFISLQVGTGGYTYVFYMREYVHLDDDLNRISENNQIKCVVIDSKGRLNDFVVYETDGYILNAKYILDERDNIHVAFVQQSDSADPESPRTVQYTHNTSGDFVDPIDVSGYIEQGDIHSFQFQLDNISMPHFFMTNFESGLGKSFLNHWHNDIDLFVKQKIDSISIDYVYPWFETVSSSKNNSGQIQLSYIADSIYQVKIANGGNSTKNGIIPRVDKHLYIVDFDAGDSTSFSPFHHMNGNYNYYLWNHVEPDTIYSFSTSLKPIGFEFDNNGIIHGIGLKGKNGQTYKELIYLKSVIQLDPLPKLPPDPPTIENKVFCLEDDKYVFSDGVENRWYQENLNNFIGMGDTLYLNHLTSGYYHFLVTENIFGISSTPTSFEVNINMPEVELGKDTSIAYLDTLELFAGQQFVSYNWNLGSDSSKAVIIGSNFDSGELPVYINVENKHGCISYDTIIVNIELPLLLEDEITNEWHVYPNPTIDAVVIDTPKFELFDDIEISICRLDGNTLFQSRI